MGNSSQYKPNDLTGKKHEFLTALRPTGAKTKNGEYLWLVRCDCGKEFEITSSRFARNKSCGCAMYTNNSSLFKVMDFTGYETKHSIALYPTTKRSYSYTIWVMRCKRCGQEFETAAYNITKGSATHKHCLVTWHENHKDDKRKEPIPNDGAHVNALYGRYRNSARERKLLFDITKDQAKCLFEQPCHYCGALPSVRYTHASLAGQYAWNGIDRVNSELGYTINNCVPCCGTCNFAKGTKTIEDFRTWIEKVYLHMFGT